MNRFTMRNALDDCVRCQNIALSVKWRGSIIYSWNKKWENRLKSSKCSQHPWRKGRSSSVDIVTRYRLDGPGIESRWGWDFPYPSRPVLGAHPASYTKGTGLTSHHNISPRLKKENSYTFTPPSGPSRHVIRCNLTFTSVPTGIRGAHIRVWSCGRSRQLSKYDNIKMSLKGL